MKDEEYYRILDKMVSYCSYAERCLQDIHKKLAKYRLNPSVKEKMITYLLDHDIIDEKRFALSFATGKIRYNKWGRIKIRAYLKAKYISDKDISFAFSKLDPEEYENILNAVLDYQNAKLDGVKDKFQKVVRHAQSRGFELSLILDRLNTREKE